MGTRRFFGILAAAIAMYALDRFARRWGATESEANQALPGDDIVPHPMDESTHAVTVHAGAADIWPWLVQAGYHRGGWYTDSTFDRIQNRLIWERIAPADKRPVWKPSADRILPEFQDLKVGDIVPDGPPGTAYFTVVALEPERHLALHSTSHISSLAPESMRGTKLAPDGEFSWVFVLAEEGPRQTRLILRTRTNYELRYLRVISRFFFTIGELLFPLPILRGIKRRVESSGEREAATAQASQS
jgi:hypothetical protein